MSGKNSQSLAIVGRRFVDEPGARFRSLGDKVEAAMVLAFHQVGPNLDALKKAA